MVNANEKTRDRNLEALNLGYSTTRRTYNVYIPALKRFTQAYPTSFEEDHYLKVDELARSPPHVSIAEARAAKRLATAPGADAVQRVIQGVGAHLAAQNVATQHVAAAPLQHGGMGNAPQRGKCAAKRTTAPSAKSWPPRWNTHQSRDGFPCNEHQIPWVNRILVRWLR